MDSINLPDNIEKIYLIPVDFFQEQGFIERFTKQLAHFRARIRAGEEKEIIQGELNALFLACMKSAINDDLKIEAQLQFYGTLNFYAQQYRSIQTFKNVIASFESKELKQKLFSTFPTKAKMTYAETLFQYHGLIKNDEPLFSFEKTELLIQSKYYLWKLYIHHIEGKSKLDKLDLSHCLTILSMCLGELSRWFEPLYYLAEAGSHLKNNPNVSYSKALILETVKEKTCLNFNAVLILAIIDSCREAIKRPTILSQQKDQLEKIETASRKFLVIQKQTVKKIRSHKARIENAYRKYNKYKKFCIDSQLFLNEHALFCNCSKATTDNFRIETKHEHTKIEWVRPFEDFLDVLVADFALARQNYYYSLNGVKVPDIIGKKYSRHQGDSLVKAALLKSSFRTLYSLLDQICYGIFNVFEIDPEQALKNKYPQEDYQPKLYFLNMWDFELLDAKLFSDNFYLISLYSISRDLSNAKFAALKDFKTIRNAMEHKLFFVSTDSTVSTNLYRGASCYTKDELLEKSKILMLLTKSAIFSFAYLIRRQSKLIEKKQTA
jgi:hypothetical protein